MFRQKMADRERHKKSRPLKFVQSGGGCLLTLQQTVKHTHSIFQQRTHTQFERENEEREREKRAINTHFSDAVVHSKFKYWGFLLTYQNTFHISTSVTRLICTFNGERAKSGQSEGRWNAGSDYQKNGNQKITERNTVAATLTELSDET